MNELVQYAPGLVTEALEKVKDHPVSSQEDLLAEALVLPEDTDREGWVNFLGLACLGIVSQLGESTDPAGRAATEVVNQLTSDYNRWGDTWKHRPVEGQSERTMDRLVDYRDQHVNGGTEILFTKIAGGGIINIVRLDHPEFQLK